MWGDHMSTSGWILSIFGMLIILALIAGTITWLVRDLRGRGGSPAEPVSAREILDRRLASGEITSQEFELLRAELDTSEASGDTRAAGAAGAPG
jgi:uncharacterized membrane protein